MKNEISRLFVVLSLAGCAGAGADPEIDVAQEPGAGVRDDARTQVTGAAASDPTEGTAMMTLAMPVEQLGGPDPQIMACEELRMAAPGPGVSHAPSIVTATGRESCAIDDDGLVEMALPAHVQAVLKVVGAGFSRFHVQVTTAAGPLEMKPLRLVSDDVIGAAYQRAGMTIDAPHTAVVETPADGATVSLRIAGSSEIAAPIYVDAEGNLTDGSRSVAGGWAVFTNLPQGLHEVSMTHPELSCRPDASASWAGTTEGSIALVAARGQSALTFEPLAIAHSNAFGCR